MHFGKQNKLSKSMFVKYGEDLYIITDQQIILHQLAPKLHDSLQCATFVWTNQYPSYNVDYMIVFCLELSPKYK